MKKVFVVMYHYIRELKKSRFPEIKGLDINMFRQQIQFFKNNFNIIRMEEVIAAYDEGYELPENALLLTFDDGYIDHYTNVFPILSDYGVQGSFFVIGKTFMEHTLLDVNKIHFILASTPIEKLLKDLEREFQLYQRDCQLGNYKELFEQYAVANRFDYKEVIFFKRMLQTVLPEEIRNEITSNIFKQRIGVSEEVFAREIYLNYDQMKCMKKAGMYFGLHGYDHYWLGNLEKEQIETDIRKALECMLGIADENNWVMNYPYGSYNDDVICFVKKKGCKLGLTTEPRIADVSVDDRFRFPRLDTNDFPPKSKNYIYLE
ncbi:MAG: polysaccharide deacetylase family protein [Dehalobacterium sp.]